MKKKLKVIIEALKSSGKISQGIGLIKKMADSVTTIIVQPDEIKKNSELLNNIENTLKLSKLWLSDVEDHLSKFIKQNDESSTETSLS